MTGSSRRSRLPSLPTARPHAVRTALVSAILVAGAAVAAADLGARPERPVSQERAFGTLALRAELRTTTLIGDYCPPGSAQAQPTLACFKRDGQGVVPGLGSVAEAYLHAHDAEGCAAGEVHIVGADVRFTVAGKGTIEIALAEIPGCLPEIQNSRPPRSFTITGGTGLYAGASGGGTVQQVSVLARVARGTDTWEGTLNVPNLEFDVTAPRLAGAVSKTVRAPRGQKRARVQFAVTAEDAVDGARPVSCSPRSGTRFRLGRTRVTCSATDGSGNTATARFTVTVRRR